MSPAPLSGVQSILVRPHAPTRLIVNVVTPAGQRARWAADDPNPQNVPNSLAFSSTMPGGFENLTLVLQRDPARVWRDLEELSTVTVTGPGGEVAWQGRVEQLPDTSGDEQQITVTCVGWQSHLADDNSAREIFVDCDITSWQGPSVARQIELLQASTTTADLNGSISSIPCQDLEEGMPAGTVTLTYGALSQAFTTSGCGPGSTSIPITTATTIGDFPLGSLVTGPNPVTATAAGVAPDYTNGYPSLACQLTGPWSTGQVVEGWYDGHGIPIGSLYAAWQQSGNINPALSGWGAAMFLATDDTAVSYDEINPIPIIAPGSDTLDATTTRTWALLQLWNDSVGAGGSGVVYSLYFTALGVYGTHGLTLRGTAGPTTAQGLWASDIVAYAVGRWCPKIQVGEDTIEASSFVIPQSVYLDPTTVSQMITDAVQYELLDWGVWEQGIGAQAVPTFYMNERNGRGNSWRARSGPAQLQESGAQIAKLFNGVIVQFSDVQGQTRTYGPPGSGANETDASLLDSDPGNPCNQAGVDRYALVTLGSSTFPAALQVGQRFLVEQKLLDTAGQAALVGHVQDQNGIWWPAWMVRGGDSIEFVDAADTSPRRVVSASYDDTTRTCTIQLDQPPQTVTALLERMSVVLDAVGMG